MVPPLTLWVPCLLDSTSDQVIFEAAAFMTETEAQRVLDVWRAEGRTEPMAVNIIPLYETSDEWLADR